jgi:RHS repeat-associated protein
MVMQPERFVNSQDETDNQYLYNGKEVQEMPGGWYDYGARFYDAQLGRFHSLDPLSENYNFQSPFVYAANNPIRFIDFMGMSAKEPDEYEFDSMGNIEKVKESETDSFHKINSEGNRIEGASLELDEKVVDGEVTLATNGGKEVNYLKVTGDEAATEIFEHLANNTTESQTEFGLTRVGKNEGKDGKNMIGSNDEHIKGKTSSNIAVLDNGYTIREATHNHPSDNNDVSDGDISAAKKIQGSFPMAKLYNYTRTYGYTPYDKNTQPTYKGQQLKEIIIK